VKVGELVEFHESGFLGIILEISRDFGGYAVVLIHDDVVYENPIHMSLKMLGRTSELVSESR